MNINMHSLIVELVFILILLLLFISIWVLILSLMIILVRTLVFRKNVLTNVQSLIRPKSSSWGVGVSIYLYILHMYIIYTTLQSYMEVIR